MALSVALLCSCASVGPPEQFRQRMDRAIGQMTYDDVVHKWGLPSSVQQDDQMITARWIVGRRSFVMVPMAAIPAGIAFTPFPQSQEWQVELTFDRSTQRLTDWRYQSLSLISSTGEGT
ncbi:MAG TPA: hypothetical protein VFL31_02005 [Nitrospiraceae bacterium]|nr:hypothetical protein [Nitrospiraceae bacterium]